MPVTQRDPYHAEWVSNDHHYSADIDYARFADDRKGWRWEVFWPGGHARAGDEELIWTPWYDDAPLTVLATLASFLGAWREARTLGSPLSENWDLFSDDLWEFEPAIEEFGWWAFEHLNPYDPEEVG